ncbi:hypothetical protein B9T62_09630 [Paenibacillus donghaensis]|uniref:Uncharacterized protein n=1 Tax=Paenibacillus donghaensis TaxID=414771 RepID=A0A2Z2KDD6_9BACL|nr:hypothetical protein B9T62_09630 [Paenibacillus donghaensis]
MCAFFLPIERELKNVTYGEALKYKLQGVAPAGIMPDGDEGEGDAQQPRRNPFFHLRHAPSDICRINS